MKMMQQEPKDFAEELAELFETWAAPERYEELCHAFATHAPEDLADQFERVEGLLRGLQHTAEDSLGLGAFLVLGEARSQAQTARHLCEKFAEHQKR